MTLTPITFARGDGIGPEIMDETLRILEAAGAQLDLDEIVIGEKMYEQGFKSGIKPDAWDSLRKTGIFLKAPITTPTGGGFKSLNVTIRKSLGLFANVRPCVAYHPYVSTNFPNMDIVIVRENEEDLYAGIEYRHTRDSYEAMKLLTRPGTERICRYAFEYARANNRKKITCMVKDNIMKMSDGMFYRVFQEIGEEYPELKKDRMIVDIGSARIAARPNDFDVVVSANLYGDILSDIGAEVTGSVGLGGSANVGETCSMFEAVHGSAPDIAGQGIANPSGLLLGSVMMLVHVGQGDVATKVHNAWLKTIEDGMHTGDIYKEGHSAQKCSTKEFGDAVIKRLGETPSTLPVRHYPAGEDKKIIIPPVSPAIEVDKKLVGVDVYIDWRFGTSNELAEKLQTMEKKGGLKLTLVTNRGVKVWPDGQPETYVTDHWRCRFMQEGEAKAAQVAALYSVALETGFDVIKLENLYTYDGEAGYSAGQGE